jgi:hypothetical protein
LQPEVALQEVTVAQPTYAARLRYLPADEVDDSDVDFDGLDVRGHDNDKLGDTDGFIVNAESGRLFYVVVDSGGWFTSRRFLLPVGHATIDRSAGALRVDVSKDALRRYPEFDRDRFEAFSDDDLRAFERHMSQVCCPDEPLEDLSAGTSYFDTRRHYTQPAWWGPGSQMREPLRPVDTESSVTPSPSREQHDREMVSARERGDDVSPHLEGRAQPGDVLGLETGGERTYIGDTAEDEDKRRREAERAAPDDDEPRRSER